MPSLTCPKLGPLRWVLPIRKERLGGVGRSGPPWGTLGAPCGTPRTLSARMGRAPHTGPVDPLRSYLGQGLKTDSPEPEAAFCTKIFNKNSSVQNHSQTEAANAAPRPAEGETGGRAAPRVAGRLLSAQEASRTCLRAQGHPQLATPTTDNTHRPRDQPVLPTQDTCASALAARATPGAQPPSQGGAWCEQGGRGRLQQGRLAAQEPPGLLALGLQSLAGVLLQQLHLLPAHERLLDLRAAEAGLGRRPLSPTPPPGAREPQGPTVHSGAGHCL